MSLSRRGFLQGSAASLAIAFYVPTERHHSTGIAVRGECRVTRLAASPSRYGESAMPSTDEPSTPPGPMNASRNVPAMIDCPTTT